MDIKFNKEDKVLGFKLGEDNVWYTVFLNSKTGTKYMIEREKYIDSLYERKD